jgi:hypothetical protein
MINIESLQYWNPKGFEISSYKYSLKDRINKTFNGSGSDNTNKCNYTYNELGFRGDSVHKEGFKILSIGCSLTEGVGVNDNETWPHLFSKLIPNSVDLNFGFGGRSNDYISRCLLTYYDIIKPDLVLIMYTFTHRKEFYTENGGIEPFIPGVDWGYMEETNAGKSIQTNLSKIQNENEDFINWYKNHLLISNFLETKKCNWIWNGSNLFNSLIENNRFDGNYSNYIDYGCDGGHPGIEHNKLYSLKLYNHIYKNFKNYLPKGCTQLQTSII